MIVPFPQLSENNSGFAVGFPHLEGSLTLPSSVIPLVHSGVSSIKLSSTKPHSEQTGSPSGLMTFTPEHSLQKFVFTNFSSCFGGNSASISDHIVASISYLFCSFEI